MDERIKGIGICPLLFTGNLHVSPLYGNRESTVLHIHTLIIRSLFSGKRAGGSFPGMDAIDILVIEPEAIR